MERVLRSSLKELDSFTNITFEGVLSIFLV